MGDYPWGEYFAGPILLLALVAFLIGFVLGALTL